ncbi:MAG: serine/threonine protein kinase [Planctomycetes bacterium]|nr:serine/threonine protein kinase [Planctomycetota bacterium]
MSNAGRDLPSDGRERPGTADEPKAEDSGLDRTVPAKRRSPAPASGDGVTEADDGIVSRTIPSPKRPRRSASEKPTAKPSAEDVTQVRAAQRPKANQYGNSVIGSEIDGYVVEALLGRGATSVVYKAIEPNSGRSVALKLMSASLLDDTHARRQLLREPKVAAALECRYIAKIYSSRAVDDYFYIAYEFCDAGSIGDYAAKFPQGRLPADVALRFLKHAVEGLLVAERHRTNGVSTPVLHRDIKPDNLLLKTCQVDSGEVLEVRIGDFGAGKILEGDVDQTIGPMTVRYAAPERITYDDSSATIDHRSDMHSLGSTFYHLLTGRPAATGNDRNDIIRFAATTEYLSPRKVVSDVPYELDKVIRKMTRRYAKDRYQSFEDLRKALEVIDLGAERPEGAVDEEDEIVAVESDSGPSAAAKRTFAAILVTAILAGGGYWYWSQGRNGDGGTTNGGNSGDNGRGTSQKPLLYQDVRTRIANWTPIQTRVENLEAQIDDTVAPPALVKRVADVKSRVEGELASLIALKSQKGEDHRANAAGSNEEEQRGSLDAEEQRVAKALSDIGALDLAWQTYSSIHQSITACASAIGSKSTAASLLQLEPIKEQIRSPEIADYSNSLFLLFNETAGKIQTEATRRNGLLSAIRTRVDKGDELAKITEDLSSRIDELSKLGETELVESARAYQGKLTPLAPIASLVHRLNSAEPATECQDIGRLDQALDKLGSDTDSSVHSWKQRAREAMREPIVSGLSSIAKQLHSSAKTEIDARLDKIADDQEMPAYGEYLAKGKQILSFAKKHRLFTDADVESLKAAIGSLELPKADSDSGTASPRWPAGWTQAMIDAWDEPAEPPAAPLERVGDHWQIKDRPVPMALVKVGDGAAAEYWLIDVHEVTLDEFHRKLVGKSRVGEQHWKGLAADYGPARDETKTTKPALFFSASTEVAKDYCDSFPSSYELRVPTLQVLEALVKSARDPVDYGTPDFKATPVRGQFVDMIGKIEGLRSGLAELCQDANGDTWQVFGVSTYYGRYPVPAKPLDRALFSTKAEVFSCAEYGFRCAISLRPKPR